MRSRLIFLDGVFEKNSLKRYLFFCGLVLLLFGGFTFAETDAFPEKDYLEARRFAYGLDGIVDECKARELNAKAAEKGDPRALAWKARKMFYGGYGIPKNPSEAQALFLKIEPELLAMAEKNLPDAKRSLAITWGTLFPDQKGQQAFELLMAISREGRSFELDDLAWCYEKGIGTKTNLTKAFEYYKKSATAGNIVSFAEVGLCFEEGKGVVKNQKEAVRWYRKAAEKGDGWSLNQLGLCYEYGRGVEKDPQKAFGYYLKAAEAGDLRGQNNAGNCYYNGFGVERDYGKAFTQYKKYADQGNTSAMGNVGVCYETGNGVAKDEREAVRWYRKAAEKGDDWSLNALGRCYEFGRGVEKDPQKAFEYYLKSAAAGNAWAQNSVGNCYYNGVGVERDYGKAFSYWKKFADDGNVSAMSNVGVCYETGNGVTKDEREAVNWYRKAAEKEDRWALNQLGLCYEYGRGVEKDPQKAFGYYLKSAEGENAHGQSNVGIFFYNGTAVDRNYEKAFEYFKKSANQGNTSGIRNLGLCYETGNGVAKNEKEAIMWYLKAGDQGDGWALNRLGLCYEHGRGVDKDSQKAFEYFSRSAEVENAWGQNSVGNCYYNATGVERNYEKAFEYFNKSAAKGNANGMANLGLCYETGNGVAKDEKEAVKWYLKAGDQGDGWALNRLGLCYEYGRGVEKDPQKAFGYYLKSAEAGNAWGQNNVGNAYLNGHGVRQNDKQAYRWFQKAADQENWVAVANLGYCLQFGKGTSVDFSQALQKYEQAAQNGNTYAKKQLQNLANLCFWEKKYELSSKAYELSQKFGIPGAEDGLYRNHVLMRKSWLGADPCKGLTALWESLREDPSKNAELLALAYEALDLGYPNLARKICSQALAGICPFPSVNPALHSSFHKVRGYAILAGEDLGPRMVKDGIPAFWPSWAVPEFTGVGYFLGNVVAGSKPLESRFQFQTDFFAPGPPRWWGILSAEILSWGLQLQAGKESGWYPRLVRTAKADSRSGIDFFWGTVQRNNLNSAKADFQKAGGEDLFSALAGRMVVASQQNDLATLRELSSQLLAKLRDVQMEKEKGGPSRKGKTSLVFMERLAQAKPGALPWGDELGELSFGMGLSQAGPGSMVFSHGMLEAAKGLFWPMLLHLKPEWALWGCDLLLKRRAFLPSDAISFYELLSKKPATRAQAALRLVQLHMQFQDYSEVAQWAKTGLEGNLDPKTQAWLKAAVLWAERKTEQPEQDLPPPSAGEFPRKKTGPVSVNDPQARYLAIYVAIREAEQATARKEESLSKYEKIREDLRALEKQYPDWEPTIIQYRLKYVQKKIEELQTPR